MRCWQGAFGFGLFLMGVAGVQGCSSDCDQITQDAQAFIDEHASCSTDDDCAVVDVGCAELPSAYCGQVTMNREAAASVEWKSLQSELRDCSPESCAQCAALLSPTCTNGSCGRL